MGLEMKRKFLLFISIFFTLVLNACSFGEFIHQGQYATTRYPNDELSLEDIPFDRLITDNEIQQYLPEVQEWKVSYPKTGINPSYVNQTGSIQLKPETPDSYLIGHCVWILSDESYMGDLFEKVDERYTLTFDNDIFPNLLYEYPQHYPSDNHILRAEHHVESEMYIISYLQVYQERMMIIYFNVSDNIDYETINNIIRIAEDKLHTEY